MDLCNEGSRHSPDMIGIVIFQPKPRYLQTVQVIHDRVWCRILDQPQKLSCQIDHSHAICILRRRRIDLHYPQEKGVEIACIQLVFGSDHDMPLPDASSRLALYGDLVEQEILWSAKWSDPTRDRVAREHRRQNHISESRRFVDEPLLLFG